MERYFAELNDANIVESVLVVNESDCLDDQGVFSEQVGVEYLRDVYRDATFLESRYDGTLRRFPAMIGGTYLPELDEFRPEQPGDEWIWDDDLGAWVDPNAPEPESESTGD